LNFTVAHLSQLTRVVRATTSPELTDCVRSAEMPKAWVVRELGTPDKLRFENVEAQISGDEPVWIRIRASAVNFFDLLQIAGTYQVKPDLPFIPGAEVAGEVPAAPAESGVEAGDLVLATVAQHRP